MGLKIHTCPDQSCWILKLNGELGYEECMPVRMALDHLLRDAPQAAVVDLADISFLDSSGLGLLLSLSKECSLRGTQLVLITSKTVEDVLKITRLSETFLCTSSLTQAAARISTTIH